MGLLARFGLGSGAAGPEVEQIEAYLVADGFEGDGERTELVLGRLSARGYEFEVGRGQERTVAFSGRLPWECPCTELDGQDLGLAVAVRVTLQPPGRSDGTVHRRTLRVAPAPAVRAAIAAFAELGYRPQDARVVHAYIPDSEQHHAGWQSLFLTDPARGRRKLPHLELSFVTNPVGSTVHLRRAAPHLYEWESKPRTVTFPVAHHEADRTDLADRASAALERLRTLYRS